METKTEPTEEPTSTFDIKDTFGDHLKMIALTIFKNPLFVLMDKSKQQQLMAMMSSDMVLEENRPKINIGSSNGLHFDFQMEGLPTYSYPHPAQISISRIAKNTSFNSQHSQRVMNLDGDAFSEWKVDVSYMPQSTSNQLKGKLTDFWPSMIRFNESVLALAIELEENCGKDFYKFECNNVVHVENSRIEASLRVAKVVKDFIVDTDHKKFLRIGKPKHFVLSQFSSKVLPAGTYPEIENYIDRHNRKVYTLTVDYPSWGNGITSECTLKRIK